MSNDHLNHPIVVLDLDGTLVDSVHHHVAAWTSACVGSGRAIVIGGHRQPCDVPQSDTGYGEADSVAARWVAFTARVRVVAAVFSGGGVTSL